MILRICGDKLLEMEGKTFKIKERIEEIKSIQAELQEEIDTLAYIEKRNEGNR